MKPAIPFVILRLRLKVQRMAGKRLQSRLIFPIVDGILLGPIGGLPVLFPQEPERGLRSLSNQPINAKELLIQIGFRKYETRTQYGTTSFNFLCPIKLRGEAKPRGRAPTFDATFSTYPACDPV